MAASPTHRFGQIIGDVLEAALHAPLAKVAKRHGLFLDSKHARAARQGKTKVVWNDGKGNQHELDYVLEAGGTDTQWGRPKAFVEIAYRRYTKHSRNKAQEIQGAIAPLVETFAHDRPFVGVVLAGVFTEPALAQLRSHGYGVLYLPWESLVAAFRVAGIDARFDDSTPDADVQRKVDAWTALSPHERGKVGTSLRQLHRTDFAAFMGELEKSLLRTVTAVFVLALYGQPRTLASLESAVAYLETLAERDGTGPIVRYEVNVRYSNQDEIRGAFSSRAECLQFLRSLT